MFDGTLAVNSKSSIYEPKWSRKWKIEDRVAALLARAAGIKKLWLRLLRERKAPQRSGKTPDDI
jgi:hypothetical protein